MFGRTGVGGRARIVTLAVAIPLMLCLTPRDSHANSPKHDDSSIAGLGLRLGALVPREADYGGTGGGGVFDIVYWYEQPRFAVEPRVGFHFDVGGGDEASFFEVPIDVGAFWLLFDSNVTPYLGGGGGVRYLREMRTFHVRTGTLLITEAVNHHEDSAWGASLYARVGLLVARHRSFRVAINVDYNVTFVELNYHKNPESLTAGMTIIF